LKASKVFGSGKDDAANKAPFDDELTVEFDSATEKCYIGVEFKEFHVGLISELKYLYTSIPDKRKVSGRVKFQGS